jgi:hypothetical protein
MRDMASGSINDRFIEKWSKRFVGGARDDEKYLRLVSKVNEEISLTGYLTRPTFIEIINWKSPRIRPIFEKGDHRVYKKGIIQCLSENDDERLSALMNSMVLGLPSARPFFILSIPTGFRSWM